MMVLGESGPSHGFEGLRRPMTSCGAFSSPLYSVEYEGVKQSQRVNCVRHDRARNVPRA